MTQAYPRPIYKYIAFCCSILTGVLAVMAIAGWLTHALFLAALSNEYIPMAPATAICFLLIALSISVETSHNAEWARYVITVLSLLVALICGIIFLQFAAHLPFDVESVILHKNEFRGGIPIGRMSPFASSGIFAQAIAIFFLAPFLKTSQKSKDLSGFLGASTCLIGLVLLLGYIYGSPIFYRVGLIPISITTALGLMLIGTGIVVTAGPESFPVRLFAGESSHARLLRLFMPVLFLSLVFNAAADILVTGTTENRGLAISFSTIAFFLIICGALIIISRNVSRLLDRSTEAQRESEAQLYGITSAALNAIILIDNDGLVTFWNDAATRMFGYTKEEIARKYLHSFIMPDRHIDTFRTGFETFMLTGEGPFIGRVYEIEAKRKDGTEFPVELSLAALKLKDKWNAVGIVRDITERKMMEEALKQMAHHDALTGLPNRRLLMEILSLALAQARRHKNKLAILFLDLDGFKYINDTLGHDIGDELLKEVAERMRRSVRESDTVARIGGDEFNILLADIADADDISGIAKKIVDAIKEPFLIRGHKLHSSVSIGISIYPDDADTMEALFKSADIAMYYAKREGNTYQFYSPSMNVQSIQRM